MGLNCFSFAIPFADQPLLTPTATHSLSWHGQREVRTEECHLLLSISESRLQCVLYHLASETLLWTGHENVQGFTHELNSAVARLKEVFADQQVFRKTTVVIESSAYAMLPVSFFREENALAIYNAVQPLPSGRLLHHHIPLSEVVLLFDLPPAAENLADHVFPSVRFTSQAEACIRYALHRAGTQKLVLVNVEKQRFTLCVTDGRQVVLCNTYPVSRAEDVLYYLGNAAMRLGIDLEHVPVVAAGEIERDDTTWQLLKTYCGDMQTALEEVSWPGTAELAPQRYFNLLALLVCAS